MDEVVFGMIVLSLPIIILGMTLFGIIFPNKLLPKSMRHNRISGAIFGFAVGYTLTQMIAVFVFPYNGKLFARIMPSISSWTALWAAIAFVLIPPENGRKKIVLGLTLLFTLTIIVYLMGGN